MVTSNYSFSELEPLADRLATQIFEVALRHGIQGSFLEAQLDVWNTVRGVLAEESIKPPAYASLRSSSLSWVEQHA